MNGDDMKCGDCKYFAASGSTQGHGTCHFDPPGRNGGRGFAIVATAEWCGKFVQIGFNDVANLDLRLSVDQWRNTAMKEQATVVALTNRLGQLIDRPWWQRLLNVIPWGEK